MNRLLWHKKNVVSREIITKLNIKQRLEIKSIQVHISLKDQNFDITKFLLPALLGLELITGQKPKLHFCKQPLASLNLQKGSISGVSTRLRGKSAIAFIEKLTTSLFPSLRPFNGLPLKSLDTQGNLNFQIPDLISFPEIEQEYIHFQQGMQKNISLGAAKFLPVDISIVTNSKNLEEGKLLFSAFQIPIIDLEKN